MDIFIRPATQSDLPLLDEFQQGIISAERPYDPTMRPDPIRYYDLGVLIQSPDAVVLIAEQDGIIIGSGSAKKKKSLHYIEPEFHAYLGFMFVPEIHRGKGVNRKIMDGLLDWAKNRGLEEVRLKVYQENKSALRAYEKSGFAPYMTEMRLRNK